MWQRRIIDAYEALVRGFGRVLRDVVLPVAGLFILYQLGTARIPTSYAFLMVPVCAALLGIPIWSRQDARRRDGDIEEQRKRRRFVIRIGEDDEDGT